MKWAFGETLLTLLIYVILDPVERWIPPGGFEDRMVCSGAYKYLKRLICMVLCVSLCLSPAFTHAQSTFTASLPMPGAMVEVSDVFVPILVKGLIVHPDKPLDFEFIIDSGDAPSDPASITEHGERFAKYFLAALTVPEKELWVNLSPFEKDRVVEDNLGRTILGRDMLAQDYLLKQLSASLIDPEKDLGKAFWEKVYAKAFEKFGTTDVPVDTFNKVWIVPQRAEVFEKAASTVSASVFITDARLKVMLDSDYLAQASAGRKDGTQDISKDILREVIVPVIEEEVNQGRNFSTIRQIYHAAILAKWYRELVTDTLLEKAYVGSNKVSGVTAPEAGFREEIYARYIEAYRKGVFNYIQEGADPLSGEPIPRKYFSGGIDKFSMKDIPLDRTGHVGPAKGRSFLVGLRMEDSAQTAPFNPYETAFRILQEDAKEGQVLDFKEIGALGDVLEHAQKMITQKGLIPAQDLQEFFSKDPAVMRFNMKALSWFLREDAPREHRQRAGHIIELLLGSFLDQKAHIHLGSLLALDSSLDTLFSGTVPSGYFFRVAHTMMKVTQNEKDIEKVVKHADVLYNIHAMISHKKPLSRKDLQEFFKKAEFSESALYRGLNWYLNNGLDRDVIRTAAIIFYLYENQDQDGAFLTEKEQAMKALLLVAFLGASQKVEEIWNEISRSRDTSLPDPGQDPSGKDAAQTTPAFDSEHLAQVLFKQYYPQGHDAREEKISQIRAALGGIQKLVAGPGLISVEKITEVLGKVEEEAIIISLRWFLSSRDTHFVSRVEKIILSYYFDGITRSPELQALATEAFFLRQAIDKVVSDRGREAVMDEQGILSSTAVELVQEIVKDAMSISQNPSEDAAQNASRADVGGIDIQNIDVMRKDGGARIRFNDNAVRGILGKGFQGFTPVILKVTPIVSSPSYL